MRIFLSAGEASGDAHGAALVRALKARAPDAEFEGLGGTAMADAGMDLHHDLAGEAIMGFVEVVKHFPRIRALFHETIARIKAHPPDVIVLIDYPGFNIRLAQALKPLGIPIVYYISPQVWAWKKGRIKTLAEVVDKMLVIFPFEEQIYADAGLPCRFVGHPLADHILDYEREKRWPGKRVVALLPGSRKQEIARLMKPMVKAAHALAQDYDNLHFVTPVVNETRAAEVRNMAGNLKLEILPGGMYEALASAHVAIVASGTATLETALFGVPFVILYKVQPLTYLIAKQVVDIKNIGIVNILAGKEVVPEYIQGAVTAKSIVPMLRALMEETPERHNMIDELGKIREMLGAGGAADRAAEEILGLTIDR